MPNGRGTNLSIGSRLIVERLVAYQGAEQRTRNEDHDRLIVDRLVYELGAPRPGDIVTLEFVIFSFNRRFE